MYQKPYSVSIDVKGRVFLKRCLHPSNFETPQFTHLKIIKDTFDYHPPPLKPLNPSVTFDRYSIIGNLIFGGDYYLLVSVL